MKICQSILFLACAGLLCGGCASAPAGKHAAKVSAPEATNAAAGGDVADDDDGTPATPSLPTGKGNPEALAHYAAGVSYETNGQHEQALEEFYKSVMADPSNQAEALELARQLLPLHPEKAVTMLSKVAGQPDASPVILAWLARVDLQAGKTNEAMEACHHAIERHPESLDGYEIQLEVLAQTGKSALMLKTLDQAAKHIPNDPPVLVSLADLFAAWLKTQQKQTISARLQAVALLDRAAAIKITSAPLWEHIADTYGRLGEPKKAAAIYAKLLAEAADSTATRDLLLEKMAVTSMDAQDWTNAIQQFQTVVRDDPVRYPEAWYYLGILAEADAQPGEADAKLAEAADDFEHAIRWDQSIELAYYRLALVRANMNLPDQALEVLHRARERFPVSFDSEFFAGLVNSQIKDYEEAVRRFGAAEAIARTNNPARLDGQFYFQIGAACERDRQYDQAAGYLQKCIDMEPDDAEALNYLGFMWADRGEHLAKARADIGKAVKLEPKNAAYLDSLGWVLFKLKLPQQALPWMLKAVEFSPEPDATILDHLGDVYLALHQPAKAVEAWKKSVAVEANPDVKKKLQLFDAGAT